VRTRDNGLGRIEYVEFICPLELLEALERPSYDSRKPKVSLSGLASEVVSLMTISIDSIMTGCGKIKLCETPNNVNRAT
jgi:hypothetical protein